jgi:cation diffusion facilitator family transporter
MSDPRAGNVRISALILVLGIILMGVKFLAWFLTHSNTILTDALESIVNVLAGSFALFALWLSAQPRDEEHPYGHGKIEFISAGFEGAFVLLAGLGILVKSVYNLFYPAEIHDLDLGIYLSIATGGTNFILGWILTVRGKKTRSLALTASGEHLKSDGYTSAAMVLGLAIVFFTDQIWLDSVVAILMAGLIAYMGIRIVRRSLAGIMDETDLEVIDEILEVLNRNRKPEWIDVHNLRVIKYGTTYHIDCHVTLPWYYELKRSHDSIEELATIIERECKTDVEFFIHTDPCVETSCAVCSVHLCTHRKSELKEVLKWTRAGILANQKHRI